MNKKKKKIARFLNFVPMPAILAFGRRKQEDSEFEASLGYKMSSRPVSAM
jgi:hypothetical protein